MKANKKNPFITKKEEAVLTIVALNKKKVDLDTIKLIAKEANLKASTLKRAWDNFVQTGGRTVDRRFKTGSGTIKMKPSVVCNNHKRKDVSTSEAGTIIKYYMTNKISSRELCNKYNISVGQFYSWLKELRVSGTLLGRKIFDTKKYAKPEVKDVIWYYREPKTERKSITRLSIMEKANYRRVAEVLLAYL